MRTEAQRNRTDGEINSKGSPGPGPPAKEWKAVEAKIERPKEDSEKEGEQELELNRDKDGLRGVIHQSSVSERLLKCAALAEIGALNAYESNLF